MWRNCFCRLEWADYRSLWLNKLQLVGVLTLVHTLAFLGLTKLINWGTRYLKGYTLFGAELPICLTNLGYLSKDIS
jgi:hypothetical protein